MEKLHVNKYMASRITFARNRLLQGSSLAEQMEIESGYMPLIATNAESRRKLGNTG